jgi:hydrogenase nickel incorporation protein HypB
VADARALNPDLEVLKLSARSGEGLDAWIEWLVRRAAVPSECAGLPAL